MTLRRVAALAFVVAFALVSERAAAAARVVLLRSEDASPMIREATTRAMAELRGAGFEVVEAAAGSIPSRAELDGHVQEAGAVAAISIFQSEGQASADVWVVDRVTQKTVIRSIDVSGTPSEEVPSVLAIRAAELLRASLIEVADRHYEPPPSAPPVPPEVQGFVERDPDPPMVGVGLELDAVAILGIDAIGASVGPAARISVIGEAGIGARVSWLGPTFGATASGPEGEASIRQEILLAEAIWAPRLSIPWLAPSIAVGFGFYHLDARGDLRAPAVSRADDVWSSAAAVSGGWGVAITDDLLLRAELPVVVSTAEMGVQMSGQRVGSVGRPSFAPTIGLMGRF